MAAKFLLSEKSGGWSFNYWAHDVSTLHPRYPDDLDDTFAAIAALAQYNRDLIDGRAFSAIAGMLTGREVQEGGPYRTWLVPPNAPPAWQDTDIVVNSTIGYALALIGVRLPQLEKFISDGVRRRRLASPYYPGIFHVGYFLSRFYLHNSIDDNVDARLTLAKMIADRLSESNGQNINTLDCAMAISTLFNLGHAGHIPQKIPTALLGKLEREGFLPYAFCVDPTRDGKRCYAGSSALTAAFCAEALARYASSQITDAYRAPGIHDIVLARARTTCQTIGVELREMAIARIERVSDEKITTLTYEFQSVLWKNGHMIAPDIAEHLSLANLYGWMAYEIYDDVIDRENASPLLPCANFFLRSLAEIYHMMAINLPEIATLFERTMNSIDDANAWEQKYCRIDINRPLPGNLPSFGDYGTLADRSIGHAMGPLAELIYAGYAPDSMEYRNTEAFFRHYLIARQLHDDAHDWADDLMRGNINSVSVIILGRFKEKYPKEIAASAGAILYRLRKIFWEETIDGVAELILLYLAKARRAREDSGILTDTDFMEITLRDLESGACRAVKERNEALVFLNDYNDSTPSGGQF